MLPFENTAEDESATKIIADEFAGLLSPGDVVLLTGNLGSGKTFFVKSICNKFGIDTAASPSFSIVNEYVGEYEVNHFDFYRIKKVEELYDIGFEEYINDESKINLIEWADMFPDILPSSNYSVYIEQIDHEKRKIKIEKNG